VGLAGAEVIARHAASVVRALKAQDGGGGKGAVLISVGGGRTVVKHYVESPDP
jgi:hypothetical protein